MRKSICRWSWLPLLLGLSTSVTANDFAEPYQLPEQPALPALLPLIPADYFPVALASGDLNRDGQDDYALVIQQWPAADPQQPGNDAPAPFPDDSDPTSGPDAWRRDLLILLGNKSGEPTVQGRYLGFIPDRDQAANDDPLSYIAITEGRLEARFRHSIGTMQRQREDTTYRFRLQPDQLLLLSHYNRHHINRSTTLFEETTLDLDQGTLTRTSGSMSNPRHKKTQQDFRVTAGWTPAMITDPLRFVPE
ncbi:MAG: hypothetical protein KDI44_17930 [Thiothrix sp.]|nr:hypothetical protein [Thiothrix sp.]